MGTTLDTPTSVNPGAEAPTIGADALGLIDESLYGLTADQYEAMIDAGILPETAYVELWEGRIYAKMAKNRPHEISSSKSLSVLIRSLPPGWFVGSENTIRLGPRSAPLPDIVIVRGQPDDYSERRAGPGDVALVIELAESSLRSDLGPKLRGYARAGIAQYWVVNLVAGTVHVHREPIPGEGRFGWERTYSRGESIEIQLGDGPVVAIPVDELLPRP